MMSLKALKKSLTHRCPFPDEEFEALMQKGKELRFTARMPIVKIGSVDQRVYIVREGMARGVYCAGGRSIRFISVFRGISSLRPPRFVWASRP